MELSVVMPCLNEAETVETCVRKAVASIKENGIDGEVVVADNGSTDGSQALAESAGARVVQVDRKGYGNALMGGIRAAKGKFVIMGDADDSYDFTALMPFVEELRAGSDLVMGNRFQGGIAQGAMPRLHRYLGNPVLSFIGRLFFRSKIGDFHCGLRGFRRDTALALGLQSSGMEFASELVVKFTIFGHKITEVPTTLAVDGRSRPPHLNTWRDGWRHLRFLLLYSPRWLFLIPGLIFMTLGLVAGIALSFGPVRVGEIAFDVDTLVGAAAAMVIGFQAVLFALLTKAYGVAEGFLPQRRRVRSFLRTWSLERGLVISGLLAVAGLVGLVASLVHWQVRSFGELDPRESLRLVVPSATALIMSFQALLGTFFLSILNIRRSSHPATESSGDEVTVRDALRAKPGQADRSADADASTEPDASAEADASADASADTDADASADANSDADAPAGKRPGVSTGRG